jgi:hypothetical protein
MRDTNEWRVLGQMSWKRDYRTDYSGRRAKKIWFTRQDDWIIPKPEHVSPFVKGHRIVEAVSAEEAHKKCQQN